MLAAQPWEPRPLAPLEARWDFGDELRKGRSLLEGTEDGRTPVAVWNFMFQPILEAMTLRLEEANRVDLVDLLPGHVLFRIGLGMLQPRRIDDVWDKESMHYNAYMAEQFPSRTQFYVLQRLADPDADALIELCTVHWQGGWELGDVVCGDETVVPHKATAGHQSVQSAINVDDLSQSYSSQKTCKREMVEGDAQLSLTIAPTTNPRDAKPLQEWEEAAITGALVQSGGEKALQNLKYNTKSDLVAALSHAAEEGLLFFTRILEGGTYTQWWTTRWGGVCATTPKGALSWAEGIPAQRPFLAG